MPFDPVLCKRHDVAPKRIQVRNHEASIKRQNVFLHIREKLRMRLTMRLLLRCPKSTRKRLFKFKMRIKKFD